MSTKNDVLAALMSEQEPLSGERLARKLGISRNSVWKAIEQLRREGYTIDAGTNRGYRLADAPDRISRRRRNNRIWSFDKRLFSISFTDEDRRFFHFQIERR